MSEFIASARAWLATINDWAPAALVLTVFLTVYALRRWCPSVWLFITGYVPSVTQIDPSPVLAAIGKLLQALPNAIYGAAVSALAQGLSVKTALQGVFAGFAAAVVHEVMANYSGKLGARKGPPTGPNDYSSKRLPQDPKPPSIPPLAAACVALGLMLSGCALFESKVPALEQCAPTPAALAAQVADILAAGGDYKSALEQLALKDTEAAVLCAVEAFVGDGKVASSDGDAAAKARGREYLASKGVK